jgi:DNA-binding Lrp family transcriptional regulator
VRYSLPGAAEVQDSHIGSGFVQDDVRLLSEDELALINALQLRPRASWTELGSALGVDPVTVARRWNRLAGRGEAWVSYSPGPRLFDRVCIAFVEIDCGAGAAGTVTRALTGHPHMLTVERAAGTYDLLATVATGDLAAMSRYTLDVLPTVAGVRAVRARIVTHMFTEGGQWRIAALDPGQRARLTTPPAAPAADDRAHATTPFDRALLAPLAYDGRASHQGLATALGVSSTTVKRRLDQLVRLGLLRFRCDFARPLGGWPVAVTFWARVPPADLPDIGHALIRTPGDPQLRRRQRHPQPRPPGQPALRDRRPPLRDPTRGVPPRIGHHRAGDHPAARETTGPRPRPGGPLRRCRVWADVLVDAPHEVLAQRRRVRVVCRTGPDPCKEAVPQRLYEQEHVGCVTRTSSMAHQDRMSCSHDPILLRSVLHGCTGARAASDGPAARHPASPPSAITPALRPGIRPGSP